MKNEFTYPSSDGRTNIHAIEWTPEGEIRGILQIAHGMVEFIDRYDRFARFMADHGFVVVGNDHLGHGSSVVSEENLGFFADGDGNKCVISDLHKLMLLTKRKYPNQPYFFLGHSMGSFLARQFACYFGHSLTGVILLGTSYTPEALIITGKTLCKAVAAAKGWHYRSDLLFNMVFGSNDKPFEPARTRNDWLTKDEAIVDAYNANPLNNFRFTANGYYHLFRSIEMCQKPANMARIPKDLPIFLVSGALDPVGGQGEGVRQTFEAYQKAGLTDVTMKLYEGDRHEILNELDHDLVDNDLLNWMVSKM